MATTNQNNVTPLPAKSGGSSNGGGNDIDARLRKVEDSLTKLETHFEYLASKSDIADLKTSIADLKISIADLKTSIQEKLHEMLKWGLGIFIAAIALALTITKFF